MVARAGRVTARLKTIDRQVGWACVTYNSPSMRHVPHFLPLRQLSFVRLFLNSFYMYLWGGNVCRYPVLLVDRRQRIERVVAHGTLWLVLVSISGLGESAEFTEVLNVRSHVMHFMYHAIKTIPLFCLWLSLLLFFFHFIWGRFLSCAVIDTWTFSSSYGLFNFDVAPF